MIMTHATANRLDASASEPSISDAGVLEVTADGG